MADDVGFSGRVSGGAAAGASPRSQESGTVALDGDGVGLIDSYPLLYSVAKFLETRLRIGRKIVSVNQWVLSNEPRSNNSSTTTKVRTK